MTVAILVFIILIGLNRIHSYRTDKAVKALYAAAKLGPASTEQQKALEEVADDYSSTPAGREAMMILGDQLFARGDFQAALGKYEDLAEHSGGVELLKIAALHKVAATQRALGKIDEAAKTYLSAAEDLKNLNKADSFYQAARCLEDLKQYDGAAKYYKKVIEISADGDTKSQSEERLLWLMANGLVSG